MSIVYILAITIVLSLAKAMFSQKNEKFFLQIYQDIHFFPRLIQKDNHIFYVLGREKRVTYAYKLDDYFIENRLKIFVKNYLMEKIFIL